MTVIETIQVRAEGHAIRHGIFRDFPLTFTDATGACAKSHSALSAFRRDGKPEPYHTERTHGVIRIYAGNKDTFVSRGDHVYVFRYSTGRQIRWFDGKPELNWNVTGNFWNFPITHAVYHLHLADGARLMRWTAFTGRVGERGTDWSADIDAPACSPSTTTRRLGPGEGLTVVAAIPAGAVEPPSPSHAAVVPIPRQPRLDHGRDRLRHRAYLLHGGLDARSAAIPRPASSFRCFIRREGISPALANYINNWGFGREKWRAFTAAALSLAVRGLLTFDQHGETLTLKSTGKQPAGGFASCRRASARSSPGSTGRRQSSISTAPTAKPSPRSGKASPPASKAENRNRFFRRNLAYVAAGAVMTGAGRVRRDRVRRPGGQGYRPFCSARLWRHLHRHVRGADRAGVVRRRQIREAGAQGRR